MHRAIRRKLEKMNTHPILQDIVLDGIRNHIEDQTMDPYKYPDNYQLLVASQNNIGWDNFLKGRLSTHWAEHQEQHLRNTDEVTNKRNGTTWTTNLAATLLDQWYRLWKQRNEDKHGKEWKERLAAKYDQIRRKVTLLYENAANAPEHLMDSIYTCDLETQLEKTPSELVAWLANWMPVYEDHIRQQRRQAQSATLAENST